MIQLWWVLSVLITLIIGFQSMYNVYVCMYYTHHTWHVFLSSLLLSELFTAVISNNSSVPVFLIPLIHKKEILQKPLTYLFQ